MSGLYQNILQKFPYLTEDKLAEILEVSELISLREGEVFIHAGEAGARVGFVLQGMMRNYILTADGQQATVLIASEMETIAAYRELFLGTAASETSAAIEDTLLLAFDFHELRSKAFADPMVMRVYIEMIEHTLVAAIERIEDFTQRKPVDRYRRLLDTQPSITGRAPLKYLASYLGITPVSLSRIRKRMSQGR